MSLPIFLLQNLPLFMENLLYLHGLDGKLSEEKRAIMSVYFNVIAPNIDYRKDNVDEIITTIFDNNEILGVVGSSMGGYVGYHISRQRDLPCLLFNPALFERSVVLKFTTHPKYAYYNNFMTIVLGKKDKVVNSDTTMKELKNDNTIQQITFSYHTSLEHRIDINTFDFEFTKFSETF